MTQEAEVRSYLKTGHLYKFNRGVFGGSWNERIYHLLPNQLLYLRSANDPKAKYVNLEGVTVELRAPFKGKQHCFELVTADNTILLAASTMEEKEDWVAAIMKRNDDLFDRPPESKFSLNYLKRIGSSTLSPEGSLLNTKPKHLRKLAQHMNNFGFDDYDYYNEPQDQTFEPEEIEVPEEEIIRDTTRAELFDSPDDPIVEGDNFYSEFVAITTNVNTLLVSRQEQLQNFYRRFVNTARITAKTIIDEFHISEEHQTYKPFRHDDQHVFPNLRRRPEFQPEFYADDFMYYSYYAHGMKFSWVQDENNTDRDRLSVDTAELSIKSAELILSTDSAAFYPALEIVLSYKLMTMRVVAMFPTNAQCRLVYGVKDGQFVDLISEEPTFETFFDRLGCKPHTVRSSSGEVTIRGPFDLRVIEYKGLYFVENHSRLLPSAFYQPPKTEKEMLLRRYLPNYLKLLDGLSVNSDAFLKLGDERDDENDMNELFALHRDFVSYVLDICREIDELNINVTSPFEVEQLLMEKGIPDFYLGFMYQNIHLPTVRTAFLTEMASRVLFGVMQENFRAYFRELRGKYIFLHPEQYYSMMYGGNDFGYQEPIHNEPTLNVPNTHEGASIAHSMTSGRSRHNIGGSQVDENSPNMPQSSPYQHQPPQVDEFGVRQSGGMDNRAGGFDEMGGENGKFDPETNKNTYEMSREEAIDYMNRQLGSCLCSFYDVYIWGEHDSLREMLQKRVATDYGVENFDFSILNPVLVVNRTNSLIGVVFNDRHIDSVYEAWEFERWQMYVKVAMIDLIPSRGIIHLLNTKLYNEYMINPLYLNSSIANYCYLISLEYIDLLKSLMDVTYQSSTALRKSDEEKLQQKTVKIGLQELGIKKLISLACLYLRVCLSIFPRFTVISLRCYVQLLHIVNLMDASQWSFIERSNMNPRHIHAYCSYYFRILGDENLLHVPFFKYLSDHYKHENDCENSVTSFKRALDILRKYCGPQHSVLGRYYCSAGHLFKFFGLSTEAMESYNNAMFIFESNTKFVLESSNALFFKAELALSLGDPIDALKFSTEAFKRKENLNETSPLVINNLWQMQRIYKSLDDRSSELSTLDTLFMRLKTAYQLLPESNRVILTAIKKVVYLSLSVLFSRDETQQLLETIQHQIHHSRSNDINLIKTALGELFGFKESRLSDYLLSLIRCSLDFDEYSFQKLGTLWQLVAFSELAALDIELKWIPLSLHEKQHSTLTGFGFAGTNTFGVSDVNRAL
ncbi:hypothetical protein PCE1_002278 [Barthelona sp. PCE]